MTCLSYGTLDYSSFFRAARKPARGMVSLSLALIMSCAIVAAQKKQPTQKSGRAQAKVNQADQELAKLRDDFIKATKEYKASLEKLIAFYEADVQRAETRFAQAKELFAQGLVAKRELDESERAVANAKTKVAEARQQIATADGQIANALVETQADKQMARLRPARGALIRTTSFIRYNGPGPWSLSDAGKVQNFFREKFGRALPIAVFGQGAIHNRWRLDHHNAMDVDLNPDGVEGQALMNFLRANGIPFSAFRSAIPFTATGPHIHVGLPSHRY